MTTIVTRAGKGSPLTHTELDANFTNLNTDKAGYGVGDGGSVTQATSKSTGVLLNKRCGFITMNSAALAANTTVSFVLQNAFIGPFDVLALNHISGGTAGSYMLNAQCGSGLATINVRNVTSGSLSQSIVISFALIRSSIS